jgi:hypothetical protein
MKAMLAVVSREIENNYFDPALKGLDWKALTAQAAARIDKAQTPGEMVTVIFALVDALKDSHTVFLPPAYVNRPVFGFEAKAYGDEVRIAEVKAGGRAAAAGVERGERLMSINGYGVDRTNIDLTMLVLRRLRPVGAMELLLAAGGGVPRKVRVEAEIQHGTTIKDLEQGANVFELAREVDASREMFYYKNYEDACPISGSRRSQPTAASSTAW